MKAKFTPPTLAEIEAYCKEKDLRFIIPADFFEYFSKADWIDSQNKPVQNWKNKAITLNMLNRKRKNMHNEYIARTKIIEKEKILHTKPLTGTPLFDIIPNNIFKAPEAARKPMYKQVKELLRQSPNMTPEQIEAQKTKIREQLQAIKNKELK